MIYKCDDTLTDEHAMKAVYCMRDLQVRCMLRKYEHAVSAVSCALGA